MKKKYNMCAKTKKKRCKTEMGYCPFEHGRCVTIQPLYRDTVGWKAGLAGEVVSQYTWCIMTGAGHLARVWVAIHGTVS